MRRKYFGLAIAAIATFGPLQAWGGDREIAEQIIQRLKTNRDSGALKDFTLDMKVDKGVVLFRGNVSETEQKNLVLNAAEGIDGIASVVDEVTVTASAPAPAEAKVIKPKAPLAVAPMPATEEVETLQPVEENDFSFRAALAKQAKAIRVPASPMPMEVVPGQVIRTAAVEPTNDGEIVSAVVSALNRAKSNGELKGFGVDVKSNAGVLQLTGRASSAAQRDAILRIAENTPGVAGVRESIAVPSAQGMPRLPEPPALRDVASSTLAPVAVDHVNQPIGYGTPATTASGPVGVPVMVAPYQMQQGGVQASPVGFGQMAGQPVPMAPHSAVGAPRYDAPNLPNYAWPGYAAHPNYAALTYPQQYSPSAWPYIGPFYPYPQVPLGWRRVSLEWDDGWWFLDFTDR
jgi:osmotically-inducible protein OsmY